MIRIPIPAVIATALTTVVAVWWIGTRDKDFTTPTGKAIPLADFSPGFDAPATASPRAVVPVNLRRARSATTPGAGTRPDRLLELGDLDSAPGVAEYSEHAGKGPEYLMRLATELEARGEFQRALLAWERILDSCQAGAEMRGTASSAIVRIRPTLPRWNIDPTAALPLTLQIGSTRADSSALREALYRLQKFLETDSGDQVVIHTAITANESEQAPDDGPIAIALAGQKEVSNATSLVRSTTPEDNEMGTLYRALLGEAYLMVAAHLATLDRCVPPPAPAFPDDPERDFHFQVTRLHWYIFARSLNPAPPLEVPRVDPPETDP